MYDTAELADEKAAYPPDEGRRIQVEHDQMRASLARLEKEAAQLAHRLEKVVQPAVDASVVPMPDPKSVPDVPISPLAARLQDDRRNIDRIADRLSDLCVRLET